MKQRFEKNVRVLNDILGYCHLIGANDFQVDFTMAERASEITIRCHVAGIEKASLDEARTMLSIPRQRDVEQYYWNISGEEEIDSELSLAGMMVDEATLTYEGDELTIQVVRLHTSDET